MRGWSGQTDLSSLVRCALPLLQPQNQIPGILAHSPALDLACRGACPKDAAAQRNGHREQPGADVPNDTHGEMLFITLAIAQEFKSDARLVGRTRSQPPDPASLAVQPTLVQPSTGPCSGDSPDPAGRRLHARTAPIKRKGDVGPRNWGTSHLLAPLADSAVSTGLSESGLWRTLWPFPGLDIPVTPVDIPVTSAA